MKYRLALFMALAVCSTVHAQNKRDLAVRQDKEQVSQDDSWFYDDLETALEAAAKTKRPLMVVFR